MAYDGGYGRQHGRAPGRRMPPPRDPYQPGPPQLQHQSPPPPPPQQQYNDGWQDGYDYDDGYGQAYNGQYADQGYGREPPPPRGHPRGQYGPPPGRGRNGPHMGRGGYANRPPTADSARNGPYPPRGGHPGPPRGGPGPMDRPGPYERAANSDPSANRQRMNEGPRSPGFGGFEDHNSTHPAQRRRPDYGENQMVGQMSNMDISARQRRGPSNGGGASRAQMQSPDVDYGRPPVDNRGHPRGYGYDSNYLDLPSEPGLEAGYGQQHIGGSYGPSEPQGRDEFGAPGRSMTMPLNSDPMLDRGPLQRTGTMPLNGAAPRNIPQRPSTSQGHRPPPQRIYPQEPPAASHAYDEGHNYGHDGYGRESVGDVLDSYYTPSRMSNPEYSRPAASRQSAGPNFDGPFVQRESIEEHLRPSFPDSSQPEPDQYHDMSRAKSHPDLRQPAAFELAADAPPVPPLDHARHGSLQDSYHAPNGWDEQSYGGMATTAGTTQSAPGPSRNSNPDALPSHPTPVRAGHMQGSVVNVNDRPPPVRNYNGTTPSPASRPQQQQAPPQPRSAGAPKAKVNVPVTPEELEHLRVVIKNDPNDQESALRLAKRLIEASDVLVPNLPDPRARARARERYLVDAHKILKKLTNAQNIEAMFVSADAHGRGMFSVEPDNKEAFTLYQSAAKLGHASAAYRTAVCCEIGHEEGGGTRRDPLKAIQWYKRAATLGDTPAMYKMGMIQLKGLLGQPKNPREAVSWLKRAAERADSDNPHSLHELGLLYESAQPNDTIIRDEEYAFRLFRQAADLGYKFSQFRLGCAFEYGLMGCPIDARQSIMWYSKAATQEEHQAELALSGWYLTGSEGVLQQSDTEAYLWARKAAIAGLAKAEYAMGYFTEVGIGAPANMEDAKRWYWRAASQDMQKARERLEDLKRSGKNGPRQRERISRSKHGKQQEVFR